MQGTFSSRGRGLQRQKPLWPRRRWRCSGTLAALTCVCALLAGMAGMAGITGPRVAVAADELLGEFKNWTAHRYEQDGQPVCNMWSRPIKDQGNYTKRGDIWAFVTHRPNSDRFGEISIEMGYPVKPGTDVNVRIGGKRFALFVEGESAFARTRDDPKLAAAMRAGAQMQVRGTSARGTKTVDTYSLAGFTAALKAIDKSCGAK